MKASLSFPARRLAGVIAGLSCCLLAASSACALEVSLGTNSAPPGSVVNIPVTLAGAPTNLSALAFFVTNSSSWPAPAAMASAGQAHVQCFVDDFSNGMHRVTAFVLSDPPIGDGLLLTLSYAVPPSAPPAVHPLVLPGVLATPFHSNPEARSLAENELIPASAWPGSILVLGLRPRLIPVGRLANGAFVFRVESEVASHSVLASTNLAAPIEQWENLGAPAPLGPGLYQFTDSQATNHAHRFYLLKP